MTTKVFLGTTNTSRTELTDIFTSCILKLQSGKLHNGIHMANKLSVSIFELFAETYLIKSCISSDPTGIL